MPDWLRIASATIINAALSAISTPGIAAGSGEAWKDYQSNRDPLGELGYLALGTIIFFGLLYLLHKVNERMSAKKTPKKK